jgi:acetyl-CoA acetyltransferase
LEREDREMKKVAVVGIGHGRFGVRTDASLRELAFEAVKAAWRMEVFPSKRWRAW